VIAPPAPPFSAKGGPPLLAWTYCPANPEKSIPDPSIVFRRFLPFFVTIFNYFFFFLNQFNALANLGDSTVPRVSPKFSFLYFGGIALPFFKEDSVPFVVEG